LITALCGLHPSVSRRVIGKSLCGRSIDLLQLGAGDDPVLLCGAFHGMEWLTSLLLLRFTSQMAAALETGSLISDIFCAAAGSQSFPASIRMGWRSPCTAPPLRANTGN